MTAMKEGFLGNNTCDFHVNGRAVPDFEIETDTN